MIRGSPDSQSLRGISLSKNESTMLGVFGACPVSILKFGNAAYTFVLFAISFLEILVLFELGEFDDVIYDGGFSN